LPPVAVQYADYATWQRSDRAGRFAALARRVEQLRGAPAALTFPLDMARPPVQSARGAAVPVVLPDSTLADVRGLAAAEGGTTFMVLLTAWQVLLGRFSGQRDVV